MSKKEKLGLDKVINRFNKEFEKTSSQFNKIVSDAFKQLETLQSQVQDPIKKVMEDLDKLRDREMNRFQTEFDKRLNEFHELQSQLLEKIGIEQAKPAAKKTNKTKPVKKAPVKSSAKPKSVPKVAKKTAPKKISAKKAPASKATAKSPAKTKASAKLSDINGIGPATIKKLNGSGITEVSQLAKPTQKEKKILEGLANTKGFDTWQDQANKLIQS